MRLGIALAVLAVAGVAIWQWTKDDGRGTGRAAREVSAADPEPEPESTRDSEPPTEPEKAAKKCIVFGKVTGADPLGDVRVTAEWKGGDAAATTNEAGEFEIPVPVADEMVILYLRADAPDGRVGFGLGPASGKVERQKVADIAIGAGAAVVVQTEDGAGKALGGVRVKPHRLVSYPGMGSDKFPQSMAPFVTDAQGKSLQRLGHGAYRLLAFREGFGRAALDLEVGAATGTVTITLPEQRRLKVIVRDAKAKQPVVGAIVFVRERYRDYGNPDCVTDEHGEALVAGLAPGDTVQVYAVAPGQPKPMAGPGTVRPKTVKPGESEVVLEIDLPRRVSWPVEDGDIPAPADGTRIAIRSDSGTLYEAPAQGVMENGRLVVADCAPGHIHAIAVGPEGCGARLFCKAGEDEGRAIQFRRMANIDFVMRNQDGTPAAGVRIGVFNQGNNPMGEVVTDDEGEARLEALFGDLAEVQILGEQSPQRLEHLGTIDLRKGDLRIEHTLARVLPFEIRVLLDGKPGVEPGRRLWFPELTIVSVDADEKSGLLTGSVSVPAGAQKKQSVSLFVPGFQTAKLEFELPAGGAPIRETLRLLPGLDCRVLEIGTKPESLRLEFQQRADGAWRTIDSPQMMPRRARTEHDDGWTFTGLEPDRYRLRDLRSQFVFGESDVRSGGANRIEIDYGRIGELTGVVVVPEGFPLAETRLEWKSDESPDPAVGGRQFRVDPASGAFRIDVVAGVERTLVVTHPALAPVELPVTGPATGVRVELKPGAMIRFTLPAYDEAHAERIAKYRSFRFPSVVVRLYRGAAEGVPAFEVHAVRKEGEAWIAGGFAPGKYTLFVDVPEGAPLIRPIELGKGELDLGALPTAKAGVIVVKVRVREPFAPPRIFAYAERLGEPAFSRTVNSDGEPEVQVAGLLSVRYRVRVGTHMGGLWAGRRMLDEEIEIKEGEREVLEFDLR